MVEESDSFESIFNIACRAIASDHIQHGATLLQQSKGETWYTSACHLVPVTDVVTDLCNSLEDLTTEEKHAEVLQIIAQQIHVLTKLGKLHEARVLGAELDVKEYVALDLL